MTSGRLAELWAQCETPGDPVVMRRDLAWLLGLAEAVLAGEEPADCAASIAGIEPGTSLGTWIAGIAAALRGERKEAPEGGKP
jgi:hypothetical protein